MADSLQASRFRRVLRGPEAHPRWARPALFGLLALTAVVYLWGLTRNGWANDFYAAAVQAGTKSWKAFFFGSFDSSNFITVDKTPASLWVMEISGRIFGFSQWSMLVPQALEGVASVALLYAAVRRWFGPAAGLLAGLVLAITPVAALMFRFNNPDALTPAASRPYFGGSTNNNILQLALGYNGLGRLTGNETGSVGGGGRGNAFGGAAGLLRLFHAEFAGQASWLLPAALLSLAAMVWVSRRAPRTDRTRAAALLWGGWVLVTGLVFSYMNGIIHPYYMVALAPGIAALTGIGATALWDERLGLAGRAVAAAGIAGTAAWAFLLLDRTPAWLPWLRWVVMIAAAAGAVAVLAAARLAGLARSRRGRLAVVLTPLGLAMIAGLAGPAAYTIDTIGSARTGALVSAGPQALGLGGGPGGGPGGRFAAGGPPGGFAGGQGGQAGTGASGGTGTGSAAGPQSGAPSGGSSGGFGGAGPGAGAPGGAGGPGGGLDGRTTVSSAMVKLLEQGASGYKWVAATDGSQGAAPLELATGEAVMAVGGFNGTDPAPTLAEFQQLVAKGEIHYYVGRSSESFGGGQGSSAIAQWVAAHFKSEAVGGQTVYDLTQRSS